jgi:hypothetical protein
MAQLTPQSTAVVGTILTPISPTATTGDLVPPLSSKVIVHNASGASINFTIKRAFGSDYGVARGDVVSAVAAGAKACFGPFPLDMADPAQANQVNVICSAVASVTLHVIAED